MKNNECTNIYIYIIVYHCRHATHTHTHLPCVGALPLTVLHLALVPDLDLLVRGAGCHPLSIEVVLHIVHVVVVFARKGLNDSLLYNE